jgi:hypothetical protein
LQFKLHSFISKSNECHVLFFVHFAIDVQLLLLVFIAIYWQRTYYLHCETRHCCVTEQTRVWLNETTILLYKWRISPLIFMSCNLAHDEVHSIQAKVVTFDLRQVGDFSTGTPVSSTNKINRNDMLQILLKVRLNTS